MIEATIILKAAIPLKVKSKIEIFRAKKPKFCKIGDPDKFHFCTIGTGMGHLDMEGTKISLLAAIPLKL